MVVIIGIAGSARRKSYNGALLRAAAGLVPDGVRVDVVSIKGIPLYDGDLETEQGIPAPVAELKNRIAVAEGLLLVTPEYNNSIPGPFKNVIDWLSRPPKDIPRIFGDTRVGLIGATPGRGGTHLAQAAWLPVLRTLGVRLWTGDRLGVSEAAKVFNDAGQLIDARVREALAEYMTGFVSFLEE
jgi:NAD(P)H-dependent FMN reductase